MSTTTATARILDEIIWSKICFGHVDLLMNPCFNATLVPTNTFGCDSLQIIYHFNMWLQR